MNAKLSEYTGIMTGCKLIERAPMKEYTSFRIGGEADLMLCPRSREELQRGISAAVSLGLPYIVIGNGTNLLVSDDGIEGVVIRIAGDYSGIEAEGCILRALSGTSMTMLAREAAELGLMGLEWGAGIPGSLGGAVAMNAGAYGGEIKQVITGLECLTGQGIEHILPASNDMGYRRSRFCAPEIIVLSVELTLQPDDGLAAERMREFAKRRREKQPLNSPSAGSTFKRPHGAYAGALIEQAGLKGRRVGGAEVSCLHAGFIINAGGATCRDVMELMDIVQREVMDRFGIWLEPEVMRIGR